jgi:hypothetical protein
MSEGERKQTFCDDSFRNISVPPVFLQHPVSARERAGGLRQHALEQCDHALGLSRLK